MTEEVKSRLHPAETSSSGVLDALLRAAGCEEAPADKVLGRLEGASSSPQGGPRGGISSGRGERSLSTLVGGELTVPKVRKCDFWMFMQ